MPTTSETSEMNGELAFPAVLNIYALLRRLINFVITCLPKPQQTDFNDVVTAAGFPIDDENEEGLIFTKHGGRRGCHECGVVEVVVSGSMALMRRVIMSIECNPKTLRR
ncbi:hypothetical protein F2Q68_00017896 [Brassica cretica]|uniref:Uncharacterized protein n=1 Tax=Brassica cretica TaxID=69181 RepID=A0A8S9HSE5_BRACR|nr:hypothetical protein F2Q68_00017896 [Brassica cretica]